MNRRDLVADIAERTGTDKRTADTFLQAFVDGVTAKVAKGEVVAISGFCKFARVDRAARMGRNPQTGQPIKIKASRRARITPLKAFKDAVMTPSLAPKLGKGISGGAAAAPARKTAAKKAPARATTARKTAARSTTARKAPAKKAVRRR